MLFATADAPVGLRYYPDGRGDLDEEMRRYGMLRFGSAIGFRPPYFYNRPLVERLHRATMPVRVVWGADDHMVPAAHGKAYARELGDGAELALIADAGHAVHLEKPDEVLARLAPLMVTNFPAERQTESNVRS
jgi:pimeloyl-ACP methyl ester carboxylesterase